MAADSAEPYGIELNTRLDKMSGTSPVCVRVKKTPSSYSEPRVRQLPRAENVYGWQKGEKLAWEKLLRNRK